MLATTQIHVENPHFVRLRLLILHLGALSAVFIRPTPGLLGLMFISWYVRAFGWEGGLHRYFAHRSFKTSRAFQLVLACLGAASGQRGPLWWASLHHAHHHHCDRPGDPHSPIVHGKPYAYYGWLLDRENCGTRVKSVRHLARFPELVWVNKYHYLFSYLWMAGMYALGQWTPLFGRGAGLATMVWGFFVSTWISLQGGFLINAFAHAPRSGWFSYRNFDTRDNSQNLWPLWLISMGQSWHNNHHRYMGSACNSLRWWEVDVTWLTLRMLAAIGVVWDLRGMPERPKVASVTPARMG